MDFYKVPRYDENGRLIPDEPQFRLLYLHGFASSGASGTVDLLRHAFPEAEITAPDIPVEPDEALPFLRALAEDLQPDVIVGTSMGGMYAQQLRGFLRVCVNPALQMSSYGLLKAGEHRWLNGRKDGEKTFRVTQQTLQAFRRMERAQWDGITAEETERVYGLFGRDDPYPSCYEQFRKRYPHAERYAGGHNLTGDVVKKVLAPLLRTLLGL